MRERSRRRAARVDFSSLVAPEEAAAFDSGSEYEGGFTADMDEDVDDDDNNVVDEDVDVEMGDPSSETATTAIDGAKVYAEKVKMSPETRPRSRQTPRQAAPKAPAPSASRIENLRDRMILFYGDSNEDLIRAIELRHKWSDRLFVVSQDQLEPVQPVQPALHDNRQLISTLTRTGDKFETSGFAVVVDGVQLEPSQQRVSVSAGVLNAGHGVLALDWDLSGTRLALGLRTETSDPLNMTAFQPELAPRFHPLEGSSLLHIYELNGSKLRPYASIEGRFGSVTGISWSAAALLAVLFANGSVGVLDLIEPGSYKMEPAAFPSVSNAKATCLCWKGSSLVIGYADGLVAEFDIGEDPVPSFVVQLHDSVVTSVSSGWPNMTPYLFTTGVDGNLKVTDTRDLRLIRKAPRLKHYSPVSAYLPMADSFIGLEDANTAKLIPVRQPGVQLALTSVTRHDAGISALATSPSHPLLLTGGQDGAIHITNPLRRTMVTRRKRDVQLDCTMWQLECSLKTSEYRFVEFLTTDTLSTKREGLNNIVLYPTAVTVTSLAWKPNSTWYAAGTASGLVRIENVDG